MQAESLSILVSVQKTPAAFQRQEIVILSGMTQKTGLI